jgi:hypothetical protein
MRGARSPSPGRTLTPIGIQDLSIRDKSRIRKIFANVLETIVSLPGVLPSDYARVQTEPGQLDPVPYAITKFVVERFLISGFRGALHRVP